MKRAIGELKLRPVSNYKRTAAKRRGCSICILHHMERLLVLLIILFKKSKIIRLGHHISIFSLLRHLHYFFPVYVSF